MFYETLYTNLRAHLLFVIFLLCSLPVFHAQFPGDEFLDHSEVETILTGATLIGDELIYTMVNDRLAKTSVRIVKSDGTVVDLLDEPLPYRSKTLMYKNPDGSVRILLYQLTKYEIGAGYTDIYDITYHEGQSVVDKITDIERMVSLETISSIATDSTGNIYAFASNRLNKIEGNNVVKTLELNDDGRLFSNPEGEVFFIDYPGNTIYQLEDMEPVEKLVLSDAVLEHKVIGNNNFLLLEDRILVYDNDFDFLIADFNPPVTVASLSQLQESDEGFVILDRKQDGFDLIAVDFDFNSEIAYSTEEDLVNSESLVYLSDEFFITSGSYDLEEITNHLFFRKFSFTDPFNPARVEVSLSDFYLTYIKDTTVIDAPPLFIYNAQYRLNNHGDDPPEKLLVFSSRYMSSTSSSAYFRGEHQQIFQNGDEYFADMNTTVPNTHPDPLLAAVPGADYQFNISEQATTAVEIVSSVDEDFSDNKLRLYPNPASEELFMDSDQTLKDIRVYDLSGRLVLFIPGIVEPKLDVSGWAPGQYILHIKTEEGHIKARIVVQ